MTRAEAVRKLTLLLRRVVDKDLWPRIKRASVFPTGDPFVRAMTSAFHTTRGLVDVQSREIFGFEIPKAIVFISKKVAA